MNGPAFHRGRRVTAVLGPTNTGKTHLAVERMLGHETGMIGLPLRLLAREVYDRVVAARGPHAVALITGEEKIVPESPRYYVCTVESMPVEREVDFVAIDEIQLAADGDRGHVFTDRLLHCRGTSETMLLGADTMRPLVERLLPGANFISRPRFSRLAYAGQKKITRLPRRSAVVAFSADAVYGIAELIRRQRGGAAVVMGALSPRTRNAQVALYQSGEVDYIVATDAIGMGLNMDVDHVAFAATRKFDGHRFRDLHPDEMAQIAGRAGRHMNDGTFGGTADAAPFDQPVVDAIENHTFEALRAIHWRNRDLDYSTLDNLMTSLIRPPTEGGLIRARIADDVTALEFLSRDDDVRRIATTPAAVEKLWDVCQIPDYRNITGGEHAGLVGRIFGYLTSGSGLIPEDWFDRQLAYADRTDGDIDTLANRIAHVRTWTFIANRSSWLKDAAGWQDRTRTIEDRLSDALHEQLTRRFIDRRTSVLMKRLREKEEFMASVSGQGEIIVEGEHAGRLIGFHFVPDNHGEGAEGRAVRSATLKVIANEIAQRAEALAAAADDAIAIGDGGRLIWNGEPVARLQKGDHVLRPRVIIIADDQLTGPARQNVQDRLDAWVRKHVETLLEPLVALDTTQDIEGLARGLAFRLVESLGVVFREDVADDVKQLEQDARRGLRKHGVRFGAFHVFIPALLKPAPARLRLLLWALDKELDAGEDGSGLPALPPDGLTSVAFDKTTPVGFYQAAGYRVCGPRAVRIDMLERLGDLIRDRVFWKPAKDGDVRPDGSVEGGGFTVIPDMMSLVGCSGEDFGAILRTLGFRMERRKVKPGPVSNGADVESPAADTTGDAPAASTDDVPQDDPAAIAASDETPPPPTDAAGAADASPQPPADHAAAAVAAAAPDGESPAAPEEPVEIEVWKPKGRDRAARRDRAGPPQRSGEKRQTGKKPGAGRKGSGKHPGRKQENRRPREKPVDKDSPFAALGALKKALEDEAGGKT